MAERVHPSPPPAAAVQIQMPENRIRKEQEEALIREARQKDFVYGAPPELPPDHPSHAARRRAGYGGRRGKRGRWCCCMISFCATLAVIAVALGITVGVMWLVLKPKVPEFRVKGAEVKQIHMVAVEGGTAVHLNATLGLRVEADNPNNKIGIYYDDIHVGVKYQGEEIGTGAVAGFYQGHRNVTEIAVDIFGSNVILTPSLASSLNQSLSVSAAGDLPLDAAVSASVRLRIGSLKTKSASVAVDCNILLSGASPGSSSTTVSSASCHFKLKTIHIF